MVHPVRTDFPFFVAQPDAVYLDSAASSQTPSCVLDAMDTYYRTYRAPVHRALYSAAARATEAYEHARQQVASYMGAADDEVLFTSGATHASNVLVYALEHTLNLAPGDEIVTTVMEHHASLVPLQQLAERRGLLLRSVPCVGTDLDLRAFEALMSPRTRLVSVMLASNVLGTVNDVARVARIAHERGAIVISDITAAMGHVPCVVHDLGVDFAYFSGHKMCGPTGIGVLYIARSWLAELEPSMFGGGMIDDVSEVRATWAEPPAKFEPGTPNIAGAIGLGEAAAYLSHADTNLLARQRESLVRYAQEVLGAQPGVTLFSAPPDRNVGIVSFTVDGIHPHDVGDLLGRRGVAVRVGHHCAQPLHKALGVPATVRASMHLYSRNEDINALVDGVKEVQRIFATA